MVYQMLSERLKWHTSTVGTVLCNSQENFYLYTGHGCAPLKAWREEGGMEGYLYHGLSIL